MKRNATSYAGLFTTAFVFCGLVTGTVSAREQGEIKPVVDKTMNALVKEHAIPGLAVAIVDDGKFYFFNYGVASRESGRKVTENTIFEVGSISKLFTATLAGYGEAQGTLSLSDKASRYFPELAGSSFDKISLLELGTYTAGGLPLQFPDSVKNNTSAMVTYYRDWQPAFAPGTHRLYSNPSIGLMGYLTAKSMKEPFADVMEKTLFPQLGLTHSYIRVPKEQMQNYAYGYSKSDKPIRVTPGVLDAEAYGVKTTAKDLIRFVALNIDNSELDSKLQQSIATTHTGYFKLGDMVQGLGWEMYPASADLPTLLSGSSSKTMLEPNEVTRLSPPRQPQPDMWLNKTGATNGFGAYVAFIPARKIGIVMLANRNYPNAARIKAAYEILSELNAKPASSH